MFQVPRSWVRRSWVNWCEKRAGLGERDSPPPFPDHARLTIVVCHWLFCWIPSCIPDSLLQPDYARHVKFCVLSLSGSRFCLVTQRCWVGALRDKTQLLLWESTIQTSQTWINFVGMHFGIESDTSRNIHPNYKLGISGKSGFYVSDWRNSITHSFVSYIISAAMISWSRFYSWWFRS